MLMIALMKLLKLKKQKKSPVRQKLRKQLRKQYQKPVLKKCLTKAQKALKAPITFLGLSLPEHGYHAPNEFYDWGQASGGVKMFVRYFEAVAGIGR